MIKKILVAFKFTPTCKSALKKALQLAHAIDAELHIYHALNYRLSVKAPDDPELVEIIEQTNSRFQEEVASDIDKHPRITFECTPADPGLEICKIARRERADLIFLGCHNESGRPCLARVDYVGMTILEKSPCPVMLVPA
jgi:nucleotide-binding universal stress UspA family protein